MAKGRYVLCDDLLFSDFAFRKCNFKLAMTDDDNEISEVAAIFIHEYKHVLVLQSSLLHIYIHRD